MCRRGCAGVNNDPVAGVIGRSFYCPFDPAHVTLLMVSKNPGQCSAEEAALYSPLGGAERVNAHESFVMDRFEGRNALITSRYHVNILSWVSVILGVELEHDAVFRKAALTALAKCQSIDDKTAKLPEATQMTCADNFLFAEIELIKPRFLLALGGDAYRFLCSPDVASRHNLPVGKLYHPSWTNMRGGVEQYIRKELPRLRSQYLRACAS